MPTTCHVTLALVTLLCILTESIHAWNSGFHAPTPAVKTGVHHDPSMFQDYVQHNKEHLQEDIKEKYHFDADTSKMSEDELTFYYFNLHDFDKNKKLDGLELLVSMNHLLDDPEAMADHHKKEAEKPIYNPEDPHSYYKMLEKQKEWNEKYKKDSEFIDNFMSRHDKNNDGFLSFSEFMEAKEYEASHPSN